MRCSRLSVLSEPSGTAVYVAGTGDFSENPEENYVQLPSSTQFGDNFTEDDYKALVADIYNGKIKIDNAVDTDMSTVAHVVFEGNIK